MQQLLRASHYPEAQGVAETILKANPGSARARFYVGLALHKQKKYSAARSNLEYGAAHAGEFREGPHAIHFLAWCAYYLGDLATARRAFEEHRRAFPNYDDTHFGLGLVALDEDKLDEAEKCFQTALELLGKQGGLPRERSKNLARLGDLALRRDEIARAEAFYRQAVELWRDHYEAWSKLARALDRQQRAEEAAVARTEHDAALQRMTAQGIPWRP